MVESTSPGSASDTRSRILAAAMSLFGEQGYAGTSVRDISERLGVTKAALYYHFSSKETILDALLEPFVSELGRLVELVRQSPPPSAQVLLERLVDVMAGPGGVLLAFVNDPSVIHRKIGKSDMLSLQQALVRALAGPAPSDIRLLRAHCAIGALRSGILGMAFERAQTQLQDQAQTQAQEQAQDGAVPGEVPVAFGGSGRSGASGRAEPLCSAALRTVAARLPQGMRPLVSAAERREIVAAALAALDAEETAPWWPGSARRPTAGEGARPAGATGSCVESATSAALSAPSVSSSSALPGVRGVGITGIGGPNPAGYPPGVVHPLDGCAD
ncbi:TetR/AcrR family transcriptional regulator [Frankia sp. QA3]|uniref:TetR/AcrR family transcriptional regulator n=1 Tax=Frankia sp. QA3 TaxID=710111 RepID=UPI000269CA9E|nr:TetR/AcrR family transcriptional regulator [Frankia sp. QA3]EIV93828.1 transcriptional regulator [Frankia sp. QA3]